MDAQYATLMVMLWESSTGKLTIANAGAEPPLVCRGGNIIRPVIEGVPIGLLDERDYEEIIFQTQKGDVLLLCSDGVGDQLNAKCEEYGHDRLARALEQHCTLAPQALVDQIFKELDAFMEDTPITDDQTIIVARVD